MHGAPSGHCGGMAEHEHEWHLAAVDFEETVVVREYTCTGCPEVLIGE